MAPVPCTSTGDSASLSSIYETRKPTYDFRMKWMVVIGLATAVIGGLYRWRLAPAEPDKWRLVDVCMAVLGIGGAVFFALGLILLGLKEVFR
jgi:hypothetical protein